MTINSINKNQEGLNTPLIYKKINLNNKGLPPRFYSYMNFRTNVDWLELKEKMKAEFKALKFRGEIHFVDYVTFAELKEKMKQHRMTFSHIAGIKHGFLKHFVNDSSVPSIDQVRLHPAYFDFCVKYNLTK